MVDDAPQRVAQSSSAIHSFLKDMRSYLKNKQRYVEKLGEHLINLTDEINRLDSLKTDADRRLERDVKKEKSDVYEMLDAQIELFRKTCNEFINKYYENYAKLPEALSKCKVNGTDQIAVQDVSVAKILIADIQGRKPKIYTPKFFALAEFSREIKEMHRRASSYRQSIKLDDLVRDKKPEQVQGKDVDIDIPSFSGYVNQVLAYLSEEGHKRIGVRGEIGVGKTTVLQMLNKQLEDTKHGTAIWIDYPIKQDTEDKIVEAIQDQIIGRLTLIREGDNTKADIIFTALHKNKYVLLIDQVISRIEFDKVGIQRNHKLVKVVVASSNNKIIKQMTDRDVEIEKLSKEDAFILFEKVRGKIHDTDIKHIAEQIIESCGRLPQVIKMVACDLKDKPNETKWKGMKSKIQSEPELFKLGGVGNAYKVVYEGLESEKDYLKKCILFAALFPSNHKIYEDYLVECWMAERFLDFPELKTTREHGAVVLEELKDRYLLERCSDKYVKMPIYFRKVALKQQYPGEENSESWAPLPGAKTLPDAGNWKTIKRMSLIGIIKKILKSYGKFELPESPEGHNMTTLLLQHNPELVELEDSFFANKKNLKVLDLNHTGIESLPSSVSSLVSLLGLYLNDCPQLSELPTGAEELKMLEFLDIRRASIPSLPNVIGGMVRLKCLRVSLGRNNCHGKSIGGEVVEIIPPNIISKLEQLEELTIETGCCSFIADQTLKEIGNLKKLTALCFYFSSVQSLGKFVAERKSWNNPETHRRVKKFRSFKIFIGCCEVHHQYGLDIPEIIGSERHLRCSRNEEDISSVKEVLWQASAFELVGNSHVQSLSEFALENAGRLEVCIVRGCNNLQSIVNSHVNNEIKEENAGVTSGGLLPCLEKLHLFDLQSLQYIWDGSVFSESLSCLKVLTLCRCPQLTAVLYPELAEALSSLEQLKVKDCSKIADIVKVQNGGGHHRLSKSLHKLETIELENLPELESICRKELIIWKSLRKIVVRSCGKLRKVYFTLKNAEKLNVVQGDSDWWKELTWKGRSDFGSRLETIVEPALAFTTTRDFHKGESSSNGSVNPPQASNIIQVQRYMGESNLEQGMPSNDISIDTSTSNTDAEKIKNEERRRKGKDKMNK